MLTRPPPRSRSISWHDPMSHLTEARELSGLEFLSRMVEGQFPRPPIAEVLDFSLVAVAEGRAVFEIVPREFHYNPIGMVHGGVAATVLDSALGCAVQTMLPVGVAYTTLELKVNMTRTITAETGRLTATASIVHCGRSTAVAEASLRDDAGRLYGHGTTTCLILRPKDD